MKSNTANPNNGLILLIIFLLNISLLYNSCCVKGPQKVNLTNKQYISGKVIYRAERNYPNGMIKIDGLYDSKPNKDIKDFFESPSRAVLYKFDASCPLDLFQDVWFQIEEFNGVQIAIEIEKKDSINNVEERDQLDQRKKFALLNKIYLNLHNGDKHREGPKHLRIHIVRKKKNIPGLSLSEIEVRDDETDELSFRIIRTSDYPETVDTNDIYYIQFDMTIDTFQVYSLDLNHIH